MVYQVIDDIIAKLRENGISHVYSAFDSVSSERKSHGFFTVVGINSFELQTPVYSQFTIFVPYKADLDLYVTAPEKFSMESLYKYFSENIMPSVMNFSGVNCNIRKISIKHDSNINRHVLTARLSVSGLEKFERGIK
ncbi:MAG: hypothetical protein K2J08_04340 [Ruminococcus sp.]|nr:hypothetical protein [Ruminococcus sp.]